MHVNPYEAVAAGGGRWLRANFHAHAGDPKYGCGIEEVIERYRGAGYDVPCITNHGGKAVTLLGGNELAGLEEKYGVALFNGYEYSCGRHVVCVGVSSVMERKDAHREAIDRCRREGGFAVIAHPNDRSPQSRWTGEDIGKLTGYAGVEIVNGYFMSETDGYGVLATDVWDHLLSLGKRCWGFANDDFHRWHHLAKAWNMVYAPPGDKRAIRAAIEKGAFYCSTGLALAEISFRGGRLAVSAPPKDREAGENRYLFIGKGGRLLGEQRGVRAEYRFRGDEYYVRVKVESECGAMLWTQPVYEETFKEP